MNFMQVKDNTDKNNFKSPVIELIDEIKSVCADAGLGNSGDEYQIITEIFLYKFINDKFIYEIKKIEKKLEKFEDVFDYLSRLKKKDYEILMMRLNENIARLNPDQLISSIYKNTHDEELSLFIGSLAAAQKVQIIGNSKSIDGVKLIKTFNHLIN